MKPILETGTIVYWVHQKDALASPVILESTVIDIIDDYVLVKTPWKNVDGEIVNDVSISEIYPTHEAALPALITKYGVAISALEDRIIDFKRELDTIKKPKPQKSIETLIWEADTKYKRKDIT